MAALVFLLVAAVSFWLGAYTTAVRERALQRLVSSRNAPKTPLLQSLWALVREFVARIGSIAPASAREIPLLKRRLIRAGFRRPDAAGYFYGARVLGATAFAAAGLAWSTHVHSGRAPLITTAMAALGYIGPMQYVLWRIRRRQRAIQKGLPNALDLLVVCVESGLGIDQAMMQVGRELHAAHPDLCDEFALVNLELRAGHRRAEALHNLATRTGVDDVNKLVAVLVQTDRFGTSIAASLRGHSDYLRAMARQRAEEKAAKLAVKLVFPIFFCVLPTLFVVTVGPVITRLIRDLIPMIENL